MVGFVGAVVNSSVSDRMRDGGRGWAGLGMVEGGLGKGGEGVD